MSFYCSRGVEIIDDDPPRCFNCGGYSHSLRECPKPFDRAAVNSARKLQKSKRNQNAGSRLPSRYYQKAQSGKYDGLKPGTLDAETRQLLNLGVTVLNLSLCIILALCWILTVLFPLVKELDPPPWLNRMREIGYPPGYLGKLSYSGLLSLVLMQKVLELSLFLTVLRF